MASNDDLMDVLDEINSKLDVLLEEKQKQEDQEKEDQEKESDEDGYYGDYGEFEYYYFF